MSKFCAECGFSLSATAAFCGGCGAKIEKVCPTCGQNMPKSTTKGSSGITRAGELSSQQSQSKRKNTSSQNLPVYGVKYNKDEDCPNCGARGQIDLVCGQCGEDSY